MSTPLASVGTINNYFSENPLAKIAFDDYEIDLELYEVRRNGQLIDLGGRPLDLLVYLVHHRNRFVPKEELRREVWGGAALSAATIPTTVLELRRKLDDDAKSPRVISAKRGRGYRFEAEISLDNDIHRSRIEGFEKLHFAARKFEMESIDQAARNVRATRSGQVILLTGVAGIGKTRLLDEATTRLSPQFSTVVSRCSVLEGAPPFWAFTQLLLSAIEQEPERGPRFSENVQRLSSVHPELAFASHAFSTEQSPIDRFSLFSLWLDTIKSLATNAPVVVAFEDIHLADRDSLDLLACLAEEVEEAQILLIATHRPPTFDDERRIRLGEIAAASSSQTLRLNPLSPNEIDALLDAHGVFDEELRGDIRTRTQGIPFYITQTLRYRDHRDRSNDRDANPRGIPADGQAVVARQLSDLDSGTRKALGIAALIGDRFAAPLLAAVLGTSTGKAVEAIAPAVRAHLVKDRTTEFEFSHRLLREALDASLDPSARRRLHLSIARKLVASGDSQLRPALVSDHLAKAAPLCPPDDVIRFSELAALDARKRFAFAEASRYLDRALRAEEDRTGPNPKRLCLIIVDLASAKLYAGNRNESRRLLLHASHIARSASLPETLARIALQLAPDYLEIEIGLNDLEQIALLNEALDGLDQSATALRSMVMARLSQALQWSHCVDEVERLSREALQLAEDSRDAEAVSIALTARAESLHGPANADARLAIIERLSASPRVAGDYPTRVLTHARALTAHFEMGDIRAVERENELLRQLTRVTDFPEYRWYPAAHDAALCLMRGEIADATRHVELVRAHASTSRNCAQTAAAHDALIAFESDTLVAATHAIRDLAQSEPWAFYWRAAYALALTEGGHYERARQLCREFDERDIETMAREPGGGLSLALITEAQAELGEHNNLPKILELLERMTNRCATIGYGIGYFGSLARYAGLAAMALGDAGRSIALLRQAIEAETRRGAISWRAYAEADLARALEASGTADASIGERLAKTTHEIATSDLQRAKRKLKEAAAPLVAARDYTSRDSSPPYSQSRSLDD